MKPHAVRVHAPARHSTDAAVPGLRYVSLGESGLRRVRSGRAFRILGPRGQPVQDPATLARVRRLAIPQAWTDVWISRDPRGHIQAVGRDARGRKQYRYHARWREARDGVKYERLASFARRLPALRARSARDLRRPELGRRKVLAAVVRLLETTLIRVGNEEYARQNRSYGLTTLRDRHVKVSGARAEFRFRGKSGRDHVVTLRDARLAGIVKACQALPGRTLFQYVDESGSRRVVTSSDVNGYLRETMGADFTAKDFRTWAATVLAACALRAAPQPASARDGAHEVRKAVESVSERLGNTPAICRRSYIHPAVVAGYLEGTLPEATADERPLLAFLEQARELLHEPREGGPMRKSGRSKRASSSRKRYGAKAGQKVERAMHEMKRGKLKSGGSGKTVRSRKQAIAIGLSEARRAGGKVPPNPNE